MNNIKKLRQLGILQQSNCINSLLFIIQIRSLCMLLLWFLHGTVLLCCVIVVCFFVSLRLDLTLQYVVVHVSHRIMWSQCMGRFSKPNMSSTHFTTPNLIHKYFRFGEDWIAKSAYYTTSHASNYNIYDVYCKIHIHLKFTIFQKFYKLCMLWYPCLIWTVLFSEIEMAVTKKKTI